MFVRAEVLRLEKLGCLTRVAENPHIVLPLSSIFSKKRVVIDASRALNPYLSVAAETRLVVVTDSSKSGRKKFEPYL